jgi:hypothetical protein
MGFARGVYVGFFAMLERGMFDNFDDVAQRRSVGRVVHELHVVTRKVNELQSTLVAVAVAGLVYAIAHPALESIPAIMHLGWPGVTSSARLLRRSFLSRHVPFAEVLSPTRAPR